MEHAAVEQVLACPSCGAALAGEYCGTCGEQRPHPHHFEMRHLVHDAVHEFIHLDGKIAKTLWLLIRRPGFLTAEYWAGRRNLYIRPLRLYILFAAVHFLFSTTFVLNTSRFAETPRFKEMLERIAQRRGLSPVQSGQVGAEIDAVFKTTYHVLQFFGPLLFALVPWMLYRRRAPYYGQHAVFALHVVSFHWLWTAIAWLTMLRGRSFGPAWFLTMMLTLVYLYFAVRRLYGEGRVKSAAKALGLRGALFAADFLMVGISMTVAITAAFMKR